MRHHRELQIGELASRCGVSSKTIRYYERIGLLPDPPRSDAGYRLYGSAAEERLGFILKAKTLGLSLDEIREILSLRDDGDCPCGHVLRLVDDKIAAIDEQARALAELREELVELQREADATGERGNGAVCRLIEGRAASG